MDAEYLKTSVGPALTLAMKSMIAEQPDDAVEYIGRYLLAYVEREESKAAMAEKFAAAAAAAAAKELEVAAAAEAAAKAAEPVPITGEQELAASVGDTNEVPDLFQALVDVVKSGTGATSVYVGEKDEEEGTGVPYITFSTCTDGAGMAGQSLKGVPADGAEDDEQPEGVTFGVFKELELPEPEPAEDAEEEEEAEPRGPQYPEQLVVPNVVREPATKFFGIPRLGSYLAVPIKYQSVLHHEAVGTVSEEEVTAQEELIENAVASASAAAEEAGEDPDAAAEAAREKAKVEQGEPLVLGAKKANPKLREMVIGMHTMGQAGREFSEEQVAFAKKWADTFAQELGRAEMNLWTAELDLLTAAAEADPATEAKISEIKAPEEEKVMELMGSMPEETLAEVREFEAKQVGFGFSRDAVLAVVDRLFELQTFRISPNPEMLRILQAFMYTLNVPKESFVSGSTKKVTWSKLRLLITGDLVQTLTSFDPVDDSVPVEKYSKPEAIKELLGDLSVESAQELGLAPLYQALLDYVTKVIMLRDSYAEKVAAEKAAQDADEGES